MTPPICSSLSFGSSPVRRSTTERWLATTPTACPSIQLKNRGADVSEEEKQQRLSEIQARYAAAMNPRYAAARLWVDGILDPARTREALARSLACAAMDPHIPEFRTGVLQT